MTRSMTAFAKSSYEDKDFTLDVFIRTYNHRYLDVNLKLPLELLHVEGELRTLVSKYLSRGRVEMTVRTTFLKEGIYQVLINRALVARLIEEMKVIRSNHNLESEVELGSLLRIPGLVEMQTDVTRISPEVLAEIKEIVETCLKSLVQMRTQEGQTLARDIRERLSRLREMVAGVEDSARDYPREIRASLEKSINEILGASAPVDTARLLQEVAHYAERSDITEELVRLRSHIQQCENLLDRQDAAGRKLDFLLQEILREINTIGSKCNLLAVSQTVIEMKTEVEKIREQSQNVE